MVHEGQGQRQLVRVGALKTCAAKHDVEFVVHEIADDGMPHQLKRRPRAVVDVHARPAKFQEAGVGSRSGNPWLNVEFVGGVKPAMGLGYFLAHQPIGADDGIFGNATA